LKPGSQTATCDASTLRPLQITPPASLQPQPKPLERTTSWMKHGGDVRTNPDVGYGRARDEQIANDGSSAQNHPERSSKPG